MKSMGVATGCGCGVSCICSFFAAASLLFVHFLKCNIIHRIKLSVF